MTSITITSPLDGYLPPNPLYRLAAFAVDMLLIAIAAGALAMVLPLFGDAERLKISVNFYLYMPSQMEALPLEIAQRNYPFMTMPVFTVLIASVYFIWMESSKWQATLGKKLFRMVVVDNLGGRISPKQSAIKNSVLIIGILNNPVFLAVQLGFLPVWILYPFNLLTAYAALCVLSLVLYINRRSINERLAGCWVLRRVKNA